MKITSSGDTLKETKTPPIYFQASDKCQQGHQRLWRESVSTEVYSEQSCLPAKVKVLPLSLIFDESSLLPSGSVLVARRS